MTEVRGGRKKKESQNQGVIKLVVLLGVITIFSVLQVKNSNLKKSSRYPGPQSS